MPVQRAYCVNPVTQVDSPDVTPVINKMLVLLLLSVLHFILWRMTTPATGDDEVVTTRKSEATETEHQKRENK